VPSRIIKYRENLLPHYVNRNGDFLEARKTTATDLAAELGRDLDDIVMKALSKEPSNRYSSVAELSKDISRHLNGAKVFAPKYSPQAASRTEALPRLPANTKSLAVLPFSFLNLVSSEDTDDRFLGMGLADALITRLSKVKRFVVRPTSSITSFGDGPIDPVAAGRELNVDFILNGSIKKANDRPTCYRSAFVCCSERGDLGHLDRRRAGRRILAGRQTRRQSCRWLVAAANFGRAG
jgi:TolB-like protein